MSRRLAAHLAVLLGGSAVLLGLTISALPPSTALLQAPSTPFDRIPVPSIPQSYRLLSLAARLIPADADVVVRSEPRDPAVEETLHRNGVALLPGRRVLPAARWGVLFPDAEEQGEYIVVVGSKPANPPGTLLLETADGSLWRRGRR